MMPRLLHLSLFLLLLASMSLAGKNKHGNNRLMELLTAGIVAKVLQKQDDHHGGGGGHEYYTVPIPIPMHHTQPKHHHVTEKIIPIPIPHHTTRIIHINAGNHHGSGHHGSGFDHGGGGGGGGGYDDHHHDIGHSHDLDGHGLGGSGGGSNHHDDDHHHHHAPTIQQLLFHDNGVYGPPQRPPRPHPHHPHAMHMRRPIVGMMPGRHPMVPMPGMMPYGHPAAMNPAAAAMHPAAAAMYPAAAGAMHPSTAAAQQQMVRVRHYYALPSTRNRMLAYPQQAQLRQQQLLMLQQKRYLRPW